MALTLSRILHAGYLFECDGFRFVFDPVFENPFSRNCHAFPAVRFDIEQIRALQVDAVFLSHFHDDHCSLFSLDLVDRATPIYLYCLFDELFDMIRAMGFTQVHALQVDTVVTLGPFQVIPRRALDAGVDSMLQVRAAGLNVLNVVDAAIDPAILRQLCRQSPWDLVLWPFQTMRESEVIWPSRAEPASGALPEEWIEQLQALRPRIIVPSACQFQLEPWSWYNHAFFPIRYSGFSHQVQTALPDTQIVRLNPGVSLRLTPTHVEPASPLPWILPAGDQNVDYDYQPDLIPPATADIARQFPPLDDTQMQQVLRYCETILPEHYATLDADDSDYFGMPRAWHLTVYDHAGEGHHFYYDIAGSHMQRCQSPPRPLGWRTEVIATRLYAALTAGETLTTLYLRINDAPFDPDTQAALEAADIADDPLIRCLYDQAVCAFQREQLRQLGIVIPLS